MKRIHIALIAAMLLAAPLVAAPYDSADAERGDRSAERAVEKEEELYDKATDALDEHEWRKATQTFRRVVDLKMAHADASMYWLAYAQGKMGQRSEALDTLLELKKTFPKSKWAEDAKSLEVEIRQSAGQKIEPEHVDDEDVKLMALNGLMTSDPERATPILENILRNSASSNRLKDRALFVLTQSGSPKSLETVARIARDGSNRSLQLRAIRYLGIMGGEQTRRILNDVYSTSGDVTVKKNVLRAYMVAGDKERLLGIARTEPTVELRLDAVSQLGVIGARTELADLYGKEGAVEVRKKILSAMFISGNADTLGEIARTEKVGELRLVAIRNLGLLGGTRSGQLLLSIYETDSSSEVKESVISSLFIQNNAKALVDLARKEKDRELKHEIISKLSLMHSKVASDYLIEFLKE
jgi:tetratricopeptide (TPR) repeat protein